MASEAVATVPPSSSSARDFFMSASVSTLTVESKHAYKLLRCNRTYMSTLQERMRELMDESGWSVGEIADRAAVSSSAVSQWVNGPTLSIKLEPAIKLERDSGYSALWLANGKGPKKVADVPLTSRQDAGDEILEPEFAGKARRDKAVPIVGTAKMGDDGYYEELSPVVGAGDGHIEIATEDPNAYGLRVRGQSMFPAIRDGWYVLVEPNGQPRIGEYVLLKLNNGKKMVKELINHRQGSFEVMSVNGGVRMSFDVTEIDSVQAVGAVVSPSKWRAD